jgi:PAS domain S-box-containing protein
MTANIASQTQAPELSAHKGGLAGPVQQRLAMLENVLHHLPMMVGYWDGHQTNQFANLAYLDWFGLQPEQILRRSLQEVLGDALYAKNRPHVEAVLAGQEQKFERIVVNKVTGVARHSLAHYIPDVVDGEVQGFFALVTDVSELKQVERVLRESEDRYRTVVMDQTEIISRLRADGSYLFVNDAFCHFFDRSRESLLGSTWVPLIYAEDAERVTKELQQLCAKRPVVVIENRLLAGDGQLHWMQFSNRGIFDSDGQLLQIQSVGRDITERKAAEAALLRMNAEVTASQVMLRQMATQSESRIENERKHFAREVHDELGQVLTALRMDLLVMEMRFCADNPLLADKVLGMKALVDDAIQGVRNVAANLRPAALDMGLSDALRWLCAEFSRKAGIPCDMTSNEPSFTLDEKTSVVLFRIVQESLTNITRHAGARSATLDFTSEPNHLTVTVQDDGSGFDVAHALAESSYGLLGMQERALSLGGHVRLESAAGRGTRVEVSIPYLSDGAIKS